MTKAPQFSLPKATLVGGGVFVEEVSPKGTTIIVFFDGTESEF